MKENALGHFCFRDSTKFVFMKKYGSKSSYRISEKGDRSLSTVIQKRDWWSEELA